MSDTVLRFGDWLGDELSRRGRSMRSLAIDVGVHPGTVSKWVDNQAIPEPDNCIKIAEALKLDADFILDLAGHRPDERKEEIDLSDPLVSFAAANQHKLSDAKKRAMVEFMKEFLQEEE